MQYDFPREWLDQMRGLLGTDFEAFLGAMDDPAARSLRLNPARDPQASARFLKDRVPWAENGYYYDDTDRPGASIEHAAGAFYIQEASAMTAAAVLDAQPGEVILDLCAAPGGKSTQIAAAMAGQGALVCNEPEPTRCKALAGNLERFGVRNAAAVNALPDALSSRWEATFDAILCDAPCSGEGMFRREPEARAQWQPGSPKGCHERQLTILNEAAKMLKPGGRLVYSTCTYNTLENEGTIDGFLEAHPEFTAEPFELAGMKPAPNGRLRVFPHEVRGDGHFVCKLRKAGTLPPTEIKKSAPDKTVAALLKTLRETVCAFDMDARYVLSGEYLYAVPNAMPKLDGLKAPMRGLCLLRVGKGYIEPAHALAMAIAPEQAKQVLNLGEAEARDYLAGETIPTDAEAGWALACYKHLPLGWVKVSGGQAKNKRPKGLRLSLHID